MIYKCKWLHSSFIFHFLVEYGKLCHYLLPFRIEGARDVKSSQTKIDQMREQGVVNGTIHLLPLNLNSLSSTKEFANEVLKLTPRIDYLINNG